MCWLIINCSEKSESEKSKKIDERERERKD
jgi:hypothetical protein